MTKNALSPVLSLFVFLLVAGLIGFFSFNSQSPLLPSDAAAGISIVVTPATHSTTRGSTMTVSWEAVDAPAGSQVYLQLTPVRSTGQSEAIIVDHQPLTGSYEWIIPPVTDTLQIAGGYNLNGADIMSGKTYQIRAALYVPTTKQCFEGCPPSTGTAVIDTQSEPFTIK